MVERHSWATQQVSGVGVMTVEDARLSISSGWTPSGNITSRSGMVPNAAAASAPGTVKATGTPNGFVHVDPFRYVMQSVRSGGTYILCLDAIKDINILSTSADPTNARRDLIIAQQSDTYIGGDVTSDMVVKQVVGTPSGSPVDPTVTGSADYVVLARVTVPANATTITTGNITNFAIPWTVATGGQTPVRTQAERDALVPWEGQRCYRADKGWEEAYISGAWRLLSIPLVANTADVTAPYTDQVILSTADNYLYQWNGSAWVQTIPADNRLARGRIGSVMSGSSGTGLTTTEAVISSVTATLVSGRRYRARAVFVANAATAGANGFFKLRQKTGTTVDTSGTLIPGGRIAPNLSRANASDNSPNTVEGEFVAGSSGSFVIAWTGQMSTSTGNVAADASNHGWSFTVDDVGL